MQFIYILPGWEGSTHDGHVLRDAISRPNGLRVPKDQYYLEYFNMRHARARNIIERAFGRLKGRWAILRSPSFFPMKTQCRIIMACTLLHNLILQNMPIDPVDIDEQLMQETLEDMDGEVDQPEFITSISTSNEWTSFRNGLAQSMYNRHRAGRAH
ncbi:hypothetical protein ZWY2020_052758 [Hordeum vulgare]|nr:hypothetical protein ZWY2020_052758 [Hordeum vulgare]